MTLPELIVIAAAEGWHIRPRTLTPHPITMHDGSVVGFYCPHPAGRGRTRVGPIYVHPEYRGLRLAEQAYAGLSGPLVAYTHRGNVASEQLHRRTGFVRWYQVRGGWYWRRDGEAH